jgi:hypothetical protein
VCQVSSSAFYTPCTRTNMWLLFSRVLSAGMAAAAVDPQRSFESGGTKCQPPHLLLLCGCVCVMSLCICVRCYMEPNEDRCFLLSHACGDTSLLYALLCPFHILFVPSNKPHHHCVCYVSFYLLCAVYCVLCAVCCVLCAVRCVLCARWRSLNFWKVKTPPSSPP